MAQPLRPTSDDVPSAAGKYVYCITRLDGPRDFGEIGIGGARRVYTVHHRDLAAVVSDAPVAARDATPENVLGHELVNEVVMRECTVLPLSFGTVVSSEEDVAELLRSTYGPFADVLDRVGDKLEFGLTVLWDRERVAERVEREDPEIRRLLEDIERHADTSTYYSRQELDRLMRAAVEAAGDRYAAEIHEALRPVTVAARTSKESGDRLLFSTAFLVSRGAEQAFEARVRAIASRYQGLLTVTSTGPWPPYHFVNIKLGLGQGA